MELKVNTEGSCRQKGFLKSGMQTQSPVLHEPCRTQPRPTLGFASTIMHPPLFSDTETPCGLREHSSDI